MTTFMTVRQVFEIGRLADRCGPVAVRPLGAGYVAVELATTPEPVGPTLALALDGHGRVAAHRRLRRGTGSAA